MTLWNLEEEADILCLKSQTITTWQTAVGQLKEQLKKELKATFKAMSQEEQRFLLNDPQSVAKSSV